MKTFLFVDTNVFINFPTLDQINWLELVVAKETTIVITAINLRELNRLKDSHSHPKRTKDRAAAATKLLRLWLKDKKSIRKGVEIMYETRNAPKEIFDANSLVFEIDDDHHLAAILMFKQENPNSRIIFATQDVGLELKIETFDIEALSLPDEMRLTEEIDPLLKANRQLEQELKALKSNVAKPELVFDNGTNRLELEIFPYVPALELENEIWQLKYDNPTFSRSISGKTFTDTIFPRPLSYLESMSYPTSEEIERYNSELPEFYDNYKNWLLECERIDEIEARTFEIKLLLINQGTCPALDVDVFISSCNLSFALTDELLIKPDPPDPPIKPRSPIESRTFDSGFLYRSANPLVNISDFISRVAPPSNISAPEINTIDKGNSVLFHVQSSKHRVELELDSICVVFPKEEIRSLQLDYEIKAANVPEPIKGKLHLILKPQLP